MLCVITHAYADSVSLIPLRTLVSSADLFALMSSFLVTRRTVRCHVLSPSSSQGSQSLERQPLNPTFGNQHRHVISWASEGKKRFLRLRRCYRAVLLLRESCTGGPWSATTLSLSKAQEEGEMYLPNPLCHHHNWSLLSVCMCVAVRLRVCVLILCWVAGGWEDQLCLFIEGHCGGGRVAMITSGLAFDVIELL